MDRAKVQFGLLRLWIFYRQDDGLVKAPGRSRSRKFFEAMAKYKYKYITKY